MTDQPKPRLSVEELVELRDQLTVPDGSHDDGYTCRRCRADYHLNDERNEPSALCDTCAQDVAESIAPALLAMATELVRLESAMLFLKGGRSPSIYIQRASERGWHDPTTPKAGG